MAGRRSGISATVQLARDAAAGNGRASAWADGTRSDSHDLLLRWRENGDRRARQAFIERNLPLARQLARRYERTPEALEDLVQVASVGLVKAVDRFDADRGVAFSAYAVPTILGELRRHFRSAGWAFHVPRPLQERALKLDHATRELAECTGRLPSTRELSEHLGLSQEEVLEALGAAAVRNCESLDAPIAGRRGRPHRAAGEIGCADERLEWADARVTIAAAARRLSGGECSVLALRFAGDLTQKQIAERVGISQIKVSRLLRRAVDRLSELTRE